MTQKSESIILTLSFAPHKVVLLALVAAYCAGILPKETHRPLLATIVKYIEGPSISGNNADPVNIPTLDEIFRTIKQACLKSDNEKGAIYADDIEFRILHALWSLHSLDSLHSFITRAKSLLVDNLRQGLKLMESIPADSIPKYLLTKSSFLGNFVQNSITSFESLEFDKVVLLWQSFVSFRTSSAGLWKQKSSLQKSPPQDLFGLTQGDDDPSVIQSLLQKVNFIQPKRPEVVLLSQEDLSRLIDHQVHLLEAYGTPTHPDLKHVLMRMTQSDTGKIPSVHYIKYLECTRDADYEGAFDALHRYFDYMMSNKQTVFYHYALLSLSILHASFNCDGEAVRAIDEAISVARENKDTACLNFLLTWVFNFLKDRPHLKHDFYVSNDQLLQFLKTKTFESSKELHSLSYQADSLQLLSEGDSLVPVLESLTKSLHISLNNATTLSSFLSFCQLSALIWSKAGIYHLSDVYCSIQQETSISIAQIFSSIARRADLEFRLGNVEHSFTLLDRQKDIVKNDNRFVSELKTYESVLLVEQSIRSSNYCLAKIGIESLLAQDIPNIDILNDVYFLNAKLNMLIGNNDVAFNIVTDSLDKSSKVSNNKYWFIRYSIQMCEIMSRSGSPARVLTSSIHNLKIAAASGYGFLVLESLIVTLDILISLEQHDDAYVLLQEFLPKFKQSDNLDLTSKAYKTLAKIFITKAKRSRLQAEKDELIFKTVQSLQIAIDGFKKISNYQNIKECLILQLDIGSFLDHQEMIEHGTSTLKMVDEKLVQNSF